MAPKLLQWDIGSHTEERDEDSEGSLLDVRRRYLICRRRELRERPMKGGEIEEGHTPVGIIFRYDPSSWKQRSDVAAGRRVHK